MIGVNWACGSRRFRGQQNAPAWRYLYDCN